MAFSPSILQNLHALTSEGIALLQQLKQKLDAEQDALVARDIDAIRNCACEKATLLQSFDKNNTARANTMTQAGVSVDRKGIDALTAQIPDPAARDAFTQMWSTLEAELKDVMDANQRNELILMRNRKSLDQLMGLMRGHGQKQGNTLYNAKGSKGNYSSQSHIGKA